jgi:hypothetical protein
MFSKQSLEMLIDLVEIKLSTIMVQDKDDLRDVKKLKHCLNELVLLRNQSCCDDKGSSACSLHSGGRDKYALSHTSR